MAVFFAAIQLVPYGWRHSNPPVTQAVAWSSPSAERLARAACYDCHSNETKWPAYSYVAPLSWLARYDVDEGRDKLNFSTWDRDRGEIDEAAETIEEGSMPPWRYLPTHWDARLSDSEKRELIDALEQMEEEDGDGERRGRDDN